MVPFNGNSWALPRRVVRVSTAWLSLLIDTLCGRQWARMSIYWWNPYNFGSEMISEKPILFILLECLSKCFYYILESWHFCCCWTSIKPPWQKAGSPFFNSLETLQGFVEFYQNLNGMFNVEEPRALELLIELIWP